MLFAISISSALVCLLPGILRILFACSLIARVIGPITFLISFLAAMPAINTPIAVSIALVVVCPLLLLSFFGGNYNLRV